MSRSRRNSTQTHRSAQRHNSVQKQRSFTQFNTSDGCSQIEDQNDNKTLQESKFEQEFEELSLKLKKELDRLESRGLPKVTCCPCTDPTQISCCPCNTADGREYLQEVCPGYIAKPSHSHGRSRSKSNRKVAFK